MRNPVRFQRSHLLGFGNTGSRHASRFALVAATAVILAGCSSDSSRLDALSNPFASSARVDATPTASIPAAEPMTGLGPTAKITGTPLSSAPVAPTPVAQAPAVQPVAPARVAAAAPAAAARMSSGWSAEGGTPIVAGQGDTLSSLSSRYGVPSTALLQANGLTSASQVAPGTRLVVPVYNAGGAAIAAKPAAVARPTLAAAPVAAAAPVVAAAKPVPAKLAPVAAAPAPAAVKAAEANAAAKAKEAADKAKLAADLKAKGAADQQAKVAAAKAAEDAQKAKLAEAKAKDAEKQVKQAEAKLAADKKAVADKKAETTQVAKAGKTDPNPTAAIPPAAAEKEAASDSMNPEFRWPARGRIIQGFKSGGNDGINIAVPEGTSVKAAEGGVVAYSGSELKGYGNLVLIRHPNGFVSAYAHNGELTVKRGEQVKRGQTIAKSGQSGNVSSPQLHFELRKGSTPVDPTQFLAGL